MSPSQRRQRPQIFFVHQLQPILLRQNPLHHQRIDIHQTNLQQMQRQHVTAHRNKVAVLQTEPKFERKQSIGLMNIG